MNFGATIMTLLAGCLATAGALTVTGSKCEQCDQPLGIDEPRPLLSWTLASDQRGDHQTAYQILAASDPALLAAGKADLWDSGKVVSASSLGVAYAGKPMRSGMRVWWQVRAWDGNDQPGPYGKPQWWEMALLNRSDWHGKWISDNRPPPQRDEDHYAPAPAPLLRKGFTLTKPIRRARLYAASLGYHELRLNGQRVGENLLEPAWTRYEKRVLYATHDVTGLLHQGDNALGLMLGNGWFNPLPMRSWGHLNLREHLMTGRPQALAQLVVEYADGSTSEIITDENWRTTDGPILRNNIYLGEIYDAHQEATGWDLPGFDDHNWKPATIATGTPGVLQALSQPPIRVTETLPALKVTEPKPGVFIYDFGQNFTGLARLHLLVPDGTRVVMRYGELLNPDGTLNPMTSVCGQIKTNKKNASDQGQSVGGPGAPDIAWQSDTYIAKGRHEETYTPRFTFHGFRYMEVTGPPAALPLAAVTGLRIHSAVTDTGSFTCSNERFNKIQQMCRRTFVSNIIGVQSDCPHRERFAYGGDIVATSDAFLLNFDMSGFYQKTSRDWADSARPDGNLTDTAPFVGIDYCGLGWAMAHPLLVSQLYRYHGNKRLLEEQYDTARRWLLLVAAANPDGILKQGLSDHESLDADTKPPLLTPLFFLSATMLAEMADTLGRTDDATRFRTLAGHIRQAYQKTFLDPKTGAAGGGKQSSQAFALYAGLVPDDIRPLAIERLLENIRDKHRGHLATGICGTKLMLETLSDNGHADVVAGMVNQPDFPGWGWMLENGATTLWEHWAGGNNVHSHNHPMFGSVSQWFFNHLGGIRPAHDAVGFDKILIAPQVVGDLQWVKTGYLSTRGLVVSEWKKSDNQLEMHLEIPVGATATVFVPAKDVTDVTEGGKPAVQATGVKFLCLDRGAATFSVASGSYHFLSRH